jgi:ParB-like chromosome segregation protein Spo0J
MILELPENCTVEEKVRIYNSVSQQMYDWMGMNHPALNVQLVKAEQVEGNDYNPNKVAPPEMKLLTLSIMRDGVTMPVVVAEQDKKNKPFVVVDGFHRTTVIKNNKAINESIYGYVPVSKLNKSIEERITSTVRHNMARGTHQVELSAKLVAMLKKHNWTNARIGMELGMDADEVLRLKQITGLAELFKDKDFSNSWE